MTLCEAIFGNIEDLVSNLLYYDRKDDEDLPLDAIEEAVEHGVITIDEMVAAFKEHLESHLL